uniref:Sodium/potassium-transporting ATPase subunit beta-2 n=1 Tax=Cyanistes caeruleus TaxID=156563 RepID=A0A8C0UTA5_CYACU
MEGLSPWTSGFLWGRELGVPRHPNPWKQRFLGFPGHLGMGVFPKNSTWKPQIPGIGILGITWNPKSLGMGDFGDHLEPQIPGIGDFGDLHLLKTGTSDPPQPRNSQKMGIFPDLSRFFPVPQVNYTQPVVAVQFSNATANVDHHVECRLNAAGLRTDDERDKFAGRVAFRLRINRD